MVGTMMAIALALSAGGTAAKVVGDVKAGNAAKKAGTAEQAADESQAQLDEYNARVADLQSQDAVSRATEQENRFRTQVRGLVGTQRAGFAASGVDVGFGSAVDVQGDAAYLGELDALTIRNNGAREAWGYKVNAEDLRRRAEITRKSGAAAAEAGSARASAAYVGAAGDIIGGTTSLLNDRYGFGNATKHAKLPRGG